MNPLASVRHAMQSVLARMPRDAAGSAGFAAPARAPAARPAVFIDKDGTLIVDVPYNVDAALLRFTPHALEGLQLLDRAGYALVVVTNQPGIAAGRFTRAEFARLQHALVTRVWQEAGVELAGFYTCPHAPAAPATACLCRKPAPGMLRQAALAHGFDLGRSWMIGDILDDVEAGERAGCHTVLVDRGNETRWRAGRLRTPRAIVYDFADAVSFILDGHIHRAPRLHVVSAQAGTAE